MGSSLFPLLSSLCSLLSLSSLSLSLSLFLCLSFSLTISILHGRPITERPRREYGIFNPILHGRPITERRRREYGGSTSIYASLCLYLSFSHSLCLFSLILPLASLS